MRIITGIYKGRKIKSPKGLNKIRPTTDFTRETVFNILSNIIKFSDFQCIDLFCGTGSYGLECLSRGVNFCYFIDINTKLVSDNISLLKLDQVSTVKKSDAIRFMNNFVDKKNKYIIFADPPYHYKNYGKLINHISAFNCIFLLEHDTNFDSKNFDIKPFIHKVIGKSRISIYNFLNEDTKNG